MVTIPLTLALTQRHVGVAELESPALHPPLAFPLFGLCGGLRSVAKRRQTGSYPT